MKLFLSLLIAVICELSLAATNYELEAQSFVDRASYRYFTTLDQILADNFATDEDDEAEGEDYLSSANKLSNLKTIARELSEISEEASAFDQSKINDPQLKRALNKLRQMAYLYVLGDYYFRSLRVNVNFLSTLSTEKDQYLGGLYIPTRYNSLLAYNPDIQNIYETSSDANELKYYWKAWRDKNSEGTSERLRAMIEDFHKAATILDCPVMEMYYSNFDVQKFLGEMDKVMEELKPAYQQLHAIVRNELHKKYGNEIISNKGPIPDHLFQQVLSQAWKEDSIIESYFPFKELPPYDEFVQKFDSRQVLHKAQGFYASLGFSDLDEDFTANRLKEHTKDTCSPHITTATPKVYMTYCQKVDFRKFMQVHGNMGRIHYALEKRNLPSYFFDSYDLEYPVGEAVILSASTPKHLQAIGLAKDFTFTNKTLMNRLFRMGIHTILNIPVYYVHSKIMNELLEETIELDGVNKRYWQLMGEYAGVEPPSNRGEETIDLPYTFYLDMEENYQTQKFVSEVLGYQFYRTFCQNAGQEGQLHNCDFYGNKDVGSLMKSMMSLGSTQSWDNVISKVLTDKPTLSADALLEYYKPIIDWIQNVNEQNNVKPDWEESEKVVL